MLQHCLEWLTLAKLAYSTPQCYNLYVIIAYCIALTDFDKWKEAGTANRLSCVSASRLSADGSGRSRRLSASKTNLASFTLLLKSSKTSTAFDGRSSKIFVSNRVRWSYLHHTTSSASLVSCANLSMQLDALTRGRTDQFAVGATYPTFPIQICFSFTSASHSTSVRHCSAPVRIFALTFNGQRNISLL